MVGAPEAHHEKSGYGLRRAALSPVETLAQSVSTISPTATPVATIPLVYTLAGSGTWLAYILATAAIFLVALCVSKFARYSASPARCICGSILRRPSARLSRGLAFFRWHPG
jgi:hypothetical protein